MKQEYLDELRKELVNINYDDIDDAIEYFDQIFLDKLSEGYTQKEIIDQLDKPNEVAAQLANSDDFCYEETNYNLNEEDLVIQEFAAFDNLKIEIENVMLDIEIKKGYSSNIIISYPKSNKFYYDIDASCKKIDIEFHKKVSSFFNNTKDLKCDGKLSIQLPDKFYNLDLENISGNIQIDDCYFKNLDLENVSGDITLSNIIGQEMNFETVSGHLNTGDNLSFDIINIGSISANLNLLNTEAKEINIETISGNINLDILGNKDEYNINLSKLFKEININNINSYGTINIETISGKIDYYFHNLVE